VNLTITPDAADAIRRYTDVSETILAADNMTPIDREEARSCAAEALRCILRANPDTFDFVARMEAVEARKKGR